MGSETICPIPITPCHSTDSQALGNGNMPLDKFHLFNNLPPEIQDRVWEFCLPRRIINPYYPTVSQEVLGTFPGARCATEMPVSALIPFRLPLVSRACRRARATALRCGQYTTVLVEDEFDSISDRSVWLNKKSDWVYLNYITLVSGLGDSGLAPRVSELVRVLMFLSSSTATFKTITFCQSVTARATRHLDPISITIF